MVKTLLIHFAKSTNWIDELEKNEQIKAIPIQLNERTDEEFNNNISKIAKENFETLIIDFETVVDKYVFNDGLQFLAHFRLSASLLGKRVLCPIIVVGTEPLTAVLKQESDINQTSRLLLTEGTIYSQPIVSEIKLHLQHLQPIHPNNFKRKVLSKIFIQNPLDDNHSLANEWGIQQFEQNAKEAKDLAPSFQLDNKLANNTLFFKSLNAQKVDYSSLKTFQELQETSIEKEVETPIFSNREKITLPGLKTVGKVDLGNILLIDDKANKGWGKLLENWNKLKSYNFEYLANESDNFDEYKIQIEQKIKEKNWHLILLDLRLNPQADKGQKNVEDYSGTEILRLIKRHNRGTQVIIFTASNKAWNLKQLLVDGVQQNDEPKITADGYYTKESPELNYDEDFSQQNYNNFKTQVKDALEKSYLVDLWSKLNTFKEAIESKIEEIDDSEDAKSKMYSAISQHLSQAFEMLYLADNKNENYYNYAFLAFFMIFEELKSYYMNNVFNENTPLLKWDSEEKEYKEIDFNERAAISQIIPTIFINNWFLNPELDHSKKFSYNNWIRNGIAHSLKDDEGNAIIANQDNCQQAFNFIHNKLSNKILEI